MQAVTNPLEITNWQWVSSTQQLFGIDDDKPSSADGLLLSAVDLLKIGTILLEKRLISPKWIDTMTHTIPTPHLTLPFAQEHYSSSLFWLVPEKAPQDAFMGWGFLGQYLLVVPAKKLAAVRLYHEGLPQWRQLKQIFS